jgi:hypothetical protein
MNTFVRCARIGFFLALLVVSAPLHLTPLVAGPEDPQAGKPDDRDKKPEKSSPTTPAADSKKIAKPPECRQTATPKQVARLADKVRKAQNKKSRQVPQNP